MSGAIVVTWALWLSAGGHVHNGYLDQRYIAAYLASKEECEMVRELVTATNAVVIRSEGPRRYWSMCVRASYVMGANK